GIRDDLVTGVQTCALPISGNSAPVLDREIAVANPPTACAQGAPAGVSASAQATLGASWKGARGERLTSRFGRAQTILGRLTGPEIGRASCRERRERWGGDG